MAIARNPKNSLLIRLASCDMTQILQPSALIHHTDFYPYDGVEQQQLLSDVVQWTLKVCDTIVVTLDARDVIVNNVDLELPK